MKSIKIVGCTSVGINVLNCIAKKKSHTMVCIAADVDAKAVDKTCADIKLVVPRDISDDDFLGKLELTGNDIVFVVTGLCDDGVGLANIILKSASNVACCYAINPLDFEGAKRADTAIVNYYDLLDLGANIELIDTNRVFKEILETNPKATIQQIFDTISDYIYNDICNRSADL